MKRIVSLSVVSLGIAIAGWRWIVLQSPESPAQPPIRAQDWFWVWNQFPASVLGADNTDPELSTIRPDDYVGPESCVECHDEKYQSWLGHSHSKMNADASSETVLGRFDGSTIPIRDGTVQMTESDGVYRMIAKRGDCFRQFRVTRTIGSRMLQYYVGVQEEGSPITETTNYVGELPPVEPDSELVLPFGYEIPKQRWIPVTEVFSIDETDDSPDPFEGFVPVHYYYHCAMCHTVVPQGYRMLIDYTAMDLNKPAFHFLAKPFLESTLPAMCDVTLKDEPLTDATLQEIVESVKRGYGPSRAVTLGISCEACHYGNREHVQSKGTIPPRFFPSSPQIKSIAVFGDPFVRNSGNINLICSQCHSAPQTAKLPGGEIRKNSSEFRDAVAGACYSQLTCVHCHEPHTGIGAKWQRSPMEDDAKCVSCHGEFGSPEAQQAHTHHPVSSSGGRCMNCHMPKITEGLLDLVRTHRIGSPNDQRMILGTGTNACNLCHLDESVSWSLSHMEEWYGSRFRQDVVSRYGDPQTPAGRLWMEDVRSEIRLICMGAAKRTEARWLLPEIRLELNSDRIVNRQFAQDTYESISQTDLEKDHGYHFWMTEGQRASVLDKLSRSTQKPGQPASSE